MSAATCEQRSEEWQMARVGHVTASCLSDVMAKPRTGNGEALTRLHYKAKVVAEILSGKPCEDGFNTPSMIAGTLQEQFARAAYEVRTGNIVDECGFIEHPTVPRFGASPDGLIGSDGVLEIKSPKPGTHLTWMLAGVVPSEHQQQMLGEMACTGRKWCDFVSYCGMFPEPWDLFVIRFDRDDALIQGVEASVVKFNSDVDAVIARLKETH